MLAQEDRCPNFNHRRSNAPVRFCPMCGAVVNENVHSKQCNNEAHVKSRRSQNKYCVDCGEQLIP